MLSHCDGKVTTEKFFEDRINYLSVTLTIFLLHFLNFPYIDHLKFPNIFKKFELVESESERKLIKAKNHGYVLHEEK